jgi:hypothetical protein
MSTVLRVGQDALAYADAGAMQWRSKGHVELSHIEEVSTSCCKNHSFGMLHLQSLLAEYMPTWRMLSCWCSRCCTAALHEGISALLLAAHTFPDWLQPLTAAFQVI